jgi:hypothetical protein
VNVTRLLMLASALVTGALGLLATFLPDTVLGAMGAPVTAPLMLLVQVTGALYLGFAMLNWMAQHTLIGGIYSRPVAVGNLLHFVTAGLAMLKAQGRLDLPWLWPLLAAYIVLGTAFGVVLFRHPIPSSAPPRS